MTLPTWAAMATVTATHNDVPAGGDGPSGKEATVADDDTYADAAVAPAQRRWPPRYVRDVEACDTTELAMMTDPQVRALSAPAAELRAVRILSDRTTRWDMAQVARYLGGRKSTVEKIRTRKKHNPVPSVVDFPEPLPERREQEGRGSPSPEFLMSDVVRWASTTGERADRVTLVAFPGGRPRPGRPRGTTSSARQPVAA